MVRECSSQKLWVQSTQNQCNDLNSQTTTPDTQHKVFWLTQMLKKTTSFFFLWWWWWYKEELKNNLLCRIKRFEVMSEFLKALYLERCLIHRKIYSKYLIGIWQNCLAMWMSKLSNLSAENWKCGKRFVFFIKVQANLKFFLPTTFVL